MMALAMTFMYLAATAVPACCFHISSPGVKLFPFMVSPVLLVGPLTPRGSIWPPYIVCAPV